MEKLFFVYILASRRNGTLYVGVTGDLPRRIAEHKAKLVPGFTQNTMSICWSMLRLSPPSSKPANANTC